MVAKDFDYMLILKCLFYFLTFYDYTNQTTITPVRNKIILFCKMYFETGKL